MTKRLLVALVFTFASVPLRADISGYALITPVLDEEIHPRLVAAAPNGNVWFAGQTLVVVAAPINAGFVPETAVGFFTPSGHVTLFVVPCSKCATGEEVIHVWDLAADPDGSLWFIDNHAKADGTSIDSAIGHVTASGQFTFFAIPTSNATAIVPNGFGQSSLARAANGTIWFTENAAAKAGALNPSTGAIAEYPLEMPEQPSGITVGPDGKVWYAVGSSEIAQITPPTNGAFVEFGLAFGAFPLDVAIGSDGNLWVTEAGRSKIARFKPTSGVVTEFQPPAQSGVPQRIVPAPDGTLWFTEADGMDVGRVTVNGSFQTIATPGLQNFDITVTPDNVVYFTARDIATQQDQLLALQPHVEMRRRSVKH